MPPLARFAVLSDTHLSPAGTPDGMWNNVTCRSVSAELLGAAAAGIAARGLSQVILLGDVSDGGEPAMIAAALDTITGAAAGMRVWAVPGNHDASRSPDALTEAAAGRPGVAVLGDQHQQTDPDVAVLGHGLRSHDGGRTCEATGVPDPAGRGGRLLLWASHYPVLSQEDRFRAAGLRYPGDLRNLSHVAERVGRFDGPVLVLHGHLHASSLGQAGPVLQIGVPAAVEWPNAWTEVTLGLTPDEVTVMTVLHRIPGSWPGPVAVTTLAQPVQNWAYAAGHWEQQTAAVS